LQRIQANKYYRIAFGVLGLLAAIGAIILIENKWVTVKPILIFYLLIATLAAADSFATLMVSGELNFRTDLISLGIVEEAKNYLMWIELLSSVGILVMSVLFFGYDEQDKIPAILIKVWGTCCMLKFSRLIVYLGTFKQIGLTFEVFF
jgi:uncharacterized membrane protein